MPEKCVCGTYWSRLRRPTMTSRSCSKRQTRCTQSWLAARRSLPRLRTPARLALAAAPAISLAVLLLAWPWVRADPLARLGQNLGYIFGRGTSGTLVPDLWPLLTTDD